MSVDGRIQALLTAIAALREADPASVGIAPAAARAGIPLSTAYRLRERSEQIRSALASTAPERPVKEESAKSLRGTIRTMAVHIERQRIALEDLTVKLRALERTLEKTRSSLPSV